MTLDRILLALADWLAVSLALVALVALAFAVAESVSRPKRPRLSPLDSAPGGRAVAIEEYRRRVAGRGGKRGRGEHSTGKDRSHDDGT